MSENEQFPNSNQMSQGRSSNHQNDEEEFPQGQPYGQYGNHGTQGQRVHFDDQQNSENNYQDMSDRQQQIEEQYDRVHNLRGEEITSSVLIQGSVEGFRLNESRERVSSGKPRLSGLRSREKVESQDNYAENQNLSQNDIEDSDAGYRVSTVTPYTVDMVAHYGHFDKHISDTNKDFKEEIHRKVQTIKLEDTAELNNRVEEIKAQEARELASHNKNYQELDVKCKKLDRKNERYETVIDSWIKQWREKRLQKHLFKFLRSWASANAREKRQLEYCEVFYQRGLERRGMKGYKLFARIAGNRVYEKKIKEKVTIEVDAKVEEKKNQLQFLEAMIRELEEKYRIELRKKAILKSQCDQAYLRGVSAISMEALKMSHSTLTDYYKGMKMPNYDGQNIFTQIRSLNGASTGFQEIVENTNPNNGNDHNGNINIRNQGQQ